MKFTHVSTWLYLPLKLLLLLSFTIPIFLWGGHLFGLSREMEKSIAARGLDEMKRIKKEGLDLLASAKPGPTPVVKKGTATTDTTTVKGIDVSRYQGTVRWDKVARSGITFAFAKATGGVDYVDPRFHQNWRGMRETVLYRGAYHFFYASDDPRKQADNFIKTMGKLRKKDMPPVLDVEIDDHTDPKLIVERVLVWLKAVEKATGRRPILYTDNGFADRILTDPRLSPYALWIADYVEHIHTLPAPWKKSDWLFWQYEEKGKVDGIQGDVDMDVFKGTLDELIEFIDKAGIKEAG